MLSSKNKAILVYIFTLFVITRVVLTAVGVATRKQTANVVDQERVFSDHRYLALDIWASWDSVWYADVITNGYSATRPIEDPTLGRKNYAFFPLYPAITKILGTILFKDYILSGVLVSNVCLIGSAFLLYTLAELDYNEEVAKKSVKYLFLFPFNFVLSGFFSESLFLFLLLLFYYLVKKNRKLPAFVIGVLMSLTKVNALAAIPALMVHKSESTTKDLTRYFYISSLVVGVVIFAYYVFTPTGKPFALFTIQQTWYRRLDYPLNHVFYGFAASSFHAKWSAAVALIALIFILGSFVILSFEHWVLAVFMLFLPLSTGLLSMPRYLTIIFPIYIALGKIAKNKTADIFLSIFLCFLQIVMMGLWSVGFGLVI